jgi:hypothetical protein
MGVAPEHLAVETTAIVVGKQTCFGIGQRPSATPR